MHYDLLPEGPSRRLLQRARCQRDRAGARPADKRRGREARGRRVGVRWRSSGLPEQTRARRRATHHDVGPNDSDVATSNVFVSSREPPRRRTAGLHTGSSSPAKLRYGVILMGTAVDSIMRRGAPPPPERRRRPWGREVHVVEGLSMRKVGHARPMRHLPKKSSTYCAEGPLQAAAGCLYEPRAQMASSARKKIARRTLAEVHGVVQNLDQRSRAPRSRSHHAHYCELRKRLAMLLRASIVRFFRQMSRRVNPSQRQLAPAAVL